MNARSRLGAVAAVLAVGLLGTACNAAVTGGGGGEGPAAQVRTFTCCNSGTEIPTWLALDEGGFAKAGVPGGELQVLPPPTDVQALLSGSVDIGVVAPSSVLNAFANGNDNLVFVAGKVNEPVYRIMSATITDPAQLRGKRLGVSGQYAPPAVATYAYLEDTSGLKPFADYEVVPFPKISDLVPALAQGTIDAAVVSTPLHLEAERQGAKEVVNLSGKLHQANSWVATTRAFAERNPDAVKAYIAALAGGISRVKGDREAALNSIAKHQPGISAENAAATYDDYVETFDLSMPIDALAVYQRFTDVEEVGGVDLSRLIDDSFLRQLRDDGTLRDLGLTVEVA